MERYDETSAKSPSSLAADEIFHEDSIDHGTRKPSNDDWLSIQISSISHQAQYWAVGEKLICELHVRAKNSNNSYLWEWEVIRPQLQAILRRNMEVLWY